jgi:hypothetical protein
VPQFPGPDLGGFLSTPQVIAAVSFIVSLIAVAVSFLVARRQNALSAKDLTLTAYSTAVQGILGLKDIFRQDYQLFDDQMRIGGIEAYIPSGMDSRTFLTFTNGFWRFSYVFSVATRKDLGLTKDEREGLEKEMRIWLQAIPGFKEVYTSFIKVAKNHNPEFLRYLDKIYSDEASDASIQIYLSNLEKSYV